MLDGFFLKDNFSLPSRADAETLCQYARPRQGKLASVLEKMAVVDINAGRSCFCQKSTESAA